MLKGLDGFYLICASPRVGSTLFCEVLKSSGVAGYPSEVFDPLNEETLAVDWQIAPDDRSALLRHALFANRTPNGVGGAKLMWDALPRLLADLRKLDELSDVNAPLDRFRAVFEGVPAIHLARRNLVRTAISYWLANVTGQWAWEGGSARRLVSDIDYYAITNLHSELHAAAIGWPLFLRQAGITAPTIYYEDWARNVVDEVTELSQIHLGLNIAGRVSAQSVQLARQASDLTDEIERQWTQQTGGCHCCTRLMAQAAAA